MSKLVLSCVLAVCVVSELYAQETAPTTEQTSKDAPPLVTQEDLERETGKLRGDIRAAEKATRELAREAERARQLAEEEQAQARERAREAEARLKREIAESERSLEDVRAQAEAESRRNRNVLIAAAGVSLLVLVVAIIAIILIARRPNKNERVVEEAGDRTAEAMALFDPDVYHLDEYLKTNGRAEFPIGFKMQDGSRVSACARRTYRGEWEVLIDGDTEWVTWPNRRKRAAMLAARDKSSSRVS